MRRGVKKIAAVLHIFHISQIAARKGNYSFSLLPEPVLGLQPLLTHSRTNYRLCNQNIREYNFASSTGAETANWVSRGTRSSSLNPAIPYQGRYIIA